MKKFLSLLLALVMVFSLAACGSNAGGNSQPPVNDGNNAPAGDDGQGLTLGEFTPLTYEDRVLYDGALADFWAAIQTAQACTDKDEMYAMLAVAEAKLLESAVVVPYYSDGGNYSISHAVPRSIPTVMWGSDIDRFYSAIVTTDLLKAAERTELRAMWNEMAGTGTFEQAAKDYLAEKGYTLTNEYVYAYSSDPETWDALAAWTNTVGEAVCQTQEGLAHYDMENVLQPALAESWETSEDGLTWTFHLRPNQVWVDSQGRKVDDIKADDWVASMQHLFDNYGDSAAEIVAPMIVNGYEYCIGDIEDFSQVGVEAVDDLTLVYHLTAPVLAFDSMLTYCGFFYPMSRSYYVSQGGKFGAEYDPSAEDYTYATDSDHIAYCGTYLVSSYTQENSIVYVENPSYWNAGNLNITKVTYRYYDGSDPLATYNDAVDGKLTGAGLGTSALKACREDGLFEEYGDYISELGGTSRTALYCLNRQIFHNYNDDTAAVSPQTHDSTDTVDKDNDVFVADASIVDDAARTHVAMNNLDFRMALARGWDKASYHAQYVGDELKYVSLRNTYTPGNFVSLSKEVTLRINGTATTFAEGTCYGEIVQAQLTADGATMKVWDPTLDGGIGSSDGFDGWYDVAAAREHMAAAVEALAAQGVEVTKENPIQLDYVYYTASESMVNRAQAYKQSIDNSLEGLVQINLVGVEEGAALNNATFYNRNGAENNADMVIGQAWSADYADPSSYLMTLAPEGDGYLGKSLGLW